MSCTDQILCIFVCLMPIYNNFTFVKINLHSSDFTLQNVSSSGGVTGTIRPGIRSVSTSATVYGYTGIIDIDICTHMQMCIIHMRKFQNVYQLCACAHTCVYGCGNRY